MLRMTEFVPDHRRMADGGLSVRDQLRAHREATRPRVVRLADLTQPQRRLVLALIAAAKAA